MIIVAFLRDQGSVERSGNEVGQRRKNVEDVEIVVEKQYRHLDEVVRCLVVVDLSETNKLEVGSLNRDKIRPFLTRKGSSDRLPTAVEEGING